MKFTFTGVNSRGNTITSTVYMEEDLIPGLVQAIAQTAKARAAVAGSLVNLVKEAANG